ncbi:MAG: winged helix-turn-helix domain-containing protein [Gemmatimonadales bacterium]
MTVFAGAGNTVNQRDASSLDRRILSRREVDAIATILEILGAEAPSAFTRDIECIERHAFGDFEIDVRLRTVFRGGLPVHLTPREYDLLLALARRDGAPASAGELVEEVWRGRVGAGSRTISQHVLSLRQKLERNPSAPRYLVTIPKIGYRLEGGSRRVSTSDSAGNRR